jgi:V/A-type H+-transporting ATPase subunit B
MNQGIGQEKTRADHRELANQLYASSSRGADLRKLRDIVGEEGLSELDKRYLKFASDFESVFIGQGEKRRDIIATLSLGWKLLSVFPPVELKRVSRRFIEIYLEELKEWGKWKE